MSGMLDNSVRVHIVYGVIYRMHFACIKPFIRVLIYQRSCTSCYYGLFGNPENIERIELLQNSRAREISRCMEKEISFAAANHICGSCITIMSKTLLP